MKLAKITLSVALFGALTLGMANDLNIDAQIEQIKNASAEERVELMNEFKQQLSTMNQEDRTEAIEHLQETMQGHRDDHSDDQHNQHDKAEMEHGEFGEQTREHAHSAQELSEQMGEMTRERAHEMEQEQQHKEMENENHMQNMNQRQAGDQYDHEYGEHSNIQEHINQNGGDFQNFIDD